jgi:hypothetical protein
MSQHSRTTLPAVATLFFAVLWTTSATAAPFTAKWNSVPFDPDADDPPPSAFYDCHGFGEAGPFCNWIWDQGLEVSAPFFGPPMYAAPNPFYDAFAFDLPLLSDLSSGDGPLLQIVPRCRPSLHPCLDAFTPLSVVASGTFTSEENPGGVFFTSSRGGVVTSADGLATFAGPEWTDIAWMNIGLYRPDACGDPETDRGCTSGEQFLDLYSLTFDADPIPEPASVVLLGAGLLALARRYRRRV